MTKLRRHNPLPIDDHVMRHVSLNCQERDENGNVIGFYPQAFAHKDGEDYLSLIWLEYFGDNHSDNVTAGIEQLKAVRKGKKAMFGVAQVGPVKALAMDDSKPVRLVYYPSNHNKAHSALFCQHPTPDTGNEDLAREFYKQHY